ncbi:MAG: TdeIII family type II restriction endonuclease [Armatimonadota bacterium]|jgi:hypothetical protein
MPDSESMKAAIQQTIQDLMERVLQRVMIDDPFIEAEHRAKKPLYAALVPDEIFKGSHFERRFVTPFGTVWEQLALVAANKGLGRGFKSWRISGNVPRERLRRITEVLNNLEHPNNCSPRQRPAWNAELAYVMQGDGPLVPVTVICDIFAEDVTNNHKYAFELKAPLPNSDQTKVSKEKLLKLYSMEPRQIEGAYYALPYNPYGQRKDYAWSFPARWFDMHNDPVVLIGDEFWEMIGGSGTYQAFISAVNEIGPEYKERIYREFLGIEPPKDLQQSL